MLCFRWMVFYLCCPWLSPCFGFFLCACTERPLFFYRWAHSQWTGGYVQNRGNHTIAACISIAHNLNHVNGCIVGNDLERQNDFRISLNRKCGSWPARNVTQCSGVKHRHSASVLHSLGSVTVSAKDIRLKKTQGTIKYMHAIAFSDQLAFANKSSLKLLPLVLYFI